MKKGGSVQNKTKKSKRIKEKHKDKVLKRRKTAFSHAPSSSDYSSGRMAMIIMALMTLIGAFIAIKVFS